jgi:hypothetical protein
MSNDLTIVTEDGDLITVEKPHLDFYAKRITIRDDGDSLRVVRLTVDETLQLAHALLPDGYAINDPDA